MWVVVALVSVLLLLTGCGCDDESQPSAAEASSAEPAAPDAPSEPADAPGQDLVRMLHACEIRHRGISIDLGAPDDKSRRGYRVGPFEDVVDVQRGGATFARVLTRRVAYEFWLDEPVEGVFVSARVHGTTAGRVRVALDDRRLGSGKLVEGETRVVSLPPLSTALPAGRHRVTLTFSGRKPAPERGYAEIDWIRIGVEDDLAATYAAPTREDVVSDVVLDGTPRRSIVLRAPATVRCPMRPAPDARLRLALGFWGTGRGTAEVRVVADGEPPVKLAERRISGGAGATWVPMNIDLGGHTSQVVALELNALESSRGGRVVFGDPAVVRAEPLPRTPEARTVVLVVASGLERRHVPPWGPTGGLTAVGDLARRASAFSTYRVPSTVPAAVMASLLTGLSPRAHAVEDPAARLAESVRTLSEMFKEAGGRTAMFTGAPSTFPAFGFDAGWDEYKTYSPVKDIPASAPLDDAAKWLEQALAEEGDRRRLLVVHTRGAHPPWDVPREDVAKLPPEEYGGPIDARRGGITLGNVRARRSRAQRRLDDHDWTRLRALERAALDRQNDGLSRLIRLLERKNAWEDTLFVLVGDVAPGDPPEIPFDPAGPLEEDRLLVPLIVKFPKGGLAGREVGAQATSVDVARTILEALALQVPEHVEGVDLFQLASGREPVVGRASVAVLGDSYSTRLGSLLLTGRFGRVPKLCRLDVDPACLGDALASKPIASQALWQWTHDFEVSARARRRVPREPASVDPETAAALTVWGDI